MPIEIPAGSYCSSEETAEIAGLTQWAVQRLLRDGEIPGALRVSERCWIIPHASAEALQGRKRGRPAKKKEAEE